MSKYLVANEDVTLKEIASDKRIWAIVDVEDKDKAIDFYINEIQIHEDIFIENMGENIYIEMLKLGGYDYMECDVYLDEDEYSSLLLEFYDGNKEFYNLHREATKKYIGLYNCVEGTVSPNITKEMLSHISRKITKRSDVVALKIG